MFTFNEFDYRVESFEAYVKRLGQHFVLHEIKDEKKVAAFLSYMRPKLFNILRYFVLS